MSTYPRCGAVGPDGETCQIHADAQHDEHEWAGQVTVRKSWPNVGPASINSDTKSDPHWAVVRAGQIVVAQGECWCNGRGKHAIGLRPKSSDSRSA